MGNAKSLEKTLRRWFFNDTEISDSEKYVFESVGRKRMLTVKNVSSSDEGCYTCKTADDETSCKLLMESRDIRVMKGLKDDEAIVGESKELVVEINYENVEAQWFINGEQVREEEGKYKFDVCGRKQMLTICSVDKSNDGEIKFQAGKTKSTGILTVISAPIEFISGLEDCKATEKSTKTLQVELNRQASVKWYKDRKTLIQ